MSSWSNNMSSWSDEVSSYLPSQGQSVAKWASALSKAVRLRSPLHREGAISSRFPDKLPKMFAISFDRGAKGRHVSAKSGSVNSKDSRVAMNWEEIAPF